MSASEKLKALDGRDMVRLEAASYLAGEKDHVVPDELYAALPQIVAVVEAAERARGPLAQGRRAMTELVWTQMDFGADENLASALAALERKLP